MTPVLEKHSTRFPPAGERLFETGDKPTLDDVLSRVSQSLVVRGNAACPVCGATLVRDADVERASSAACGGCGSSLD